MKKPHGFTLIEVVMALGIMAGVMILLTTSWQGNYQRVRKIKYQTQAVYLLHQKMIEVKQRYSKDPANIPKDLQKGTFKDKIFSQYSWEWEAREFKLPELKDLLFSQESDQEPNPIQLAVANNLKQYFEDSIFELKVTLLYKAHPKARTQRMSLTSLIIDYDVPLNMNIGGGI